MITPIAIFTGGVFYLSMKKYSLLTLGLILAWPLAIRIHGAEESALAGMRSEVLDLATLTTAPAVHDAEGFESDDPHIRAIYYDALPWKGKPTRVFAWLGVPKTNGGQAADGRLPAMVLVHGGGGTAFKEWVKLWNDHGFAAISIATEGQTDEPEPADPATPKGKGWWKQHQWAGPKRGGIYEDTLEPLEDQWMYHAVADTVLANSLMRSLPEVDAEKIGLMGISWGGVVTSTVIGIDPRFAFAIPTYGCGHLFDAENQWGRALGENEIYRKVWDPMVRLGRAEMPVLWLSWPGDTHFPLDCQAASYQAAPGPRMVSLIPGMRHSHPAGWNPPDSYAFARSIVENGKPWCLQTGIKTHRSREAEAGQDNIEITFVSTKPLNSASLVSTSDSGFTASRKWHETAADLKDGPDGAWTVTATLPKETTGWFVNVRSGDLTASSDFQGK